MKKIFALILAALLLCSVLPAALAEDGPEGEPMTLEEMLGIDYSQYPKTMYVYTDNGGPLNVRSEPRVNSGNIIGQLQYGDKVTVEGPVVIDADWMVIKYKKGTDGVAYVMTRYLVNSKPKALPKKAEKTQSKEEPVSQAASAEPFTAPMMISVRTTRTSGWISFQTGPSTGADRICLLPDGHLLRAIGESGSWYQAVDPETGRTGYIHKNFVTVLGPAVEEEPAKEQMGKLMVNGEFALQCRLPEGYSMQLINAMGSRINAYITSEDKEKPILQLSVAFDELYADVDRMNDLTEDDLKALEATFTEMNDVEITYRDTAYGTKLLIARETGDDKDFVDILSVYKGYSVEFMMTPNPDAADQSLTDAQIQMCIDFLSELDFVPAE